MYCVMKLIDDKWKPIEYGLCNSAASLEVARLRRLFPQEQFRVGFW